MHYLNLVDIHHIYKKKKIILQYFFKVNINAGWNNVNFKNSTFFFEHEIPLCITVNESQKCPLETFVVLKTLNRCLSTSKNALRITEYARCIFLNLSKRGKKFWNIKRFKHSQALVLHVYLRPIMVSYMSLYLTIEKWFFFSHISSKSCYIRIF